MKAHGLIALLSLGAISHTWAADIGIGVSIKSHDNSIYAPIRITESILLEPYYRQNEFKNSYELSSSGNEQEEIGLGVFHTLADESGINVYFGLRAGYVERSNYYRSAAGDFKDVNDGYRFSPTIGIEYMLLKSLAISGEAEWYKYDLDGHRTDGGTRENIEFSSKGTDTRIIVRYYFD